MDHSCIYRVNIWVINNFSELHVLLLFQWYRKNDSPNFGRKEKCRNVIMSKSNKVENKNGTNVEMLDAYKCQHTIVRNFNALTLTRTFSPSPLFLFSTFSFFGIFMFRHFYFRPKLGLPQESSVAGELRKQKLSCITQRSTYVNKIPFVFAPNSRFSCLQK